MSQLFKWLEIHKSNRYNIPRSSEGYYSENQQPDKRQTEMSVSCPAF